MSIFGKTQQCIALEWFPFHRQILDDKGHIGWNILRAFRLSVVSRLNGLAFLAHSQNIQRGCSKWSYQCIRIERHFICFCNLCSRHYCFCNSKDTKMCTKYDVALSLLYQYIIFIKRLNPSNFLRRHESIVEYSFVKMSQSYHPMQTQKTNESTATKYVIGTY